MALRSSQRAVDLCVSAEIGSRAQYEKKYHRPERPPGQSGITVGIGYDLGYTTREKVQRDFGGRIPSAMIVAMQNVVGLKGDDAQSALASVKNKVSIPWDVAMDVFEATDFPRYEDMVLKAVPGASKLPADCFGVLSGLVYNRGAGGFTAQGDRFREMRTIRAMVNAGQFDQVPAQLRSMKRLWPDMAGLRKRRDDEADLFSKGLVEKPLPDWLNKPREAPVTPRGKASKYDVQVEAIQRNLKGMNYHELGDVDGEFGGKTRAAIVAFMTDRGKYPPGDGAVTPEVIAEVNAAVAEKWTRPIKEERKNATAKDIANKVPSVNQTWWNKLWAFVLGIPSAFAAVFKTIFGDQANVSDYIDPVKNFLAGIPPELYFLAVAAIAVAVFIQAKRTQDATVKAYQNGEIN